MLNNMKVLVGLLIVVAGLAYWVSFKDKPVTVSEQALYPSWQVNDSIFSEIDKIILSKDGEQIKLTKKGKHWQLNDGFYASIDPLFTLLQGVKNAVIVEAKTANPENHSRLELADNDLKVNISSNDKSLVDFHIGKNSSAGHTFIRKSGENQTYAVKNLDTVSFNVDGWKLKTVLDISADEVVSVSVNSNEGTEVIIERAAETGNWEIKNMPEGHQLKPSAYLDQIGNSLSRLMIDDASVKDLSEMTEILNNKYQLKNGNNLIVTVFQNEEDYFLTVDSVDYSHFADWMMKIPEYKFDSLNRKLDDYIEPILEEKVSEEVDPS